MDKMIEFIKLIKQKSIEEQFEIYFITEGAKIAAQYM